MNSFVVVNANEALNNAVDEEEREREELFGVRREMRENEKVGVIYGYGWGTLDYKKFYCGPLPLLKVEEWC